MRASDVDTLVFSAGGAQALVSHVTVVEELVARRCLNLREVNTVVGTSAGALVALGVALRMPTQAMREDIRREMQEMESCDFHVANLLRYGGCYGTGDMLADRIANTIGRALASTRYRSEKNSRDGAQRVVGLLREGVRLRRVCVACALCRLLACVIASQSCDRRPHPPANSITFAQLFHITRVRLCIVATDVERARAIVFSHTTTPDAIVARAVAASMAIPIVFPPVRVRVSDTVSHLCVDGAVHDAFPLGVTPAGGVRFSPPLDAGRTLGITVRRATHEDVRAEQKDVSSAPSSYFKALAATLLQRLTAHTNPGDFRIITVSVPVGGALFTRTALSDAERTFVNVAATIAAHEACNDIKALPP